MANPTVLVTGSAGHLGKALMLALPELGYNPIGIDIKASVNTTAVGSITDTVFVESVFARYRPDHVIHAATLHKPHVGSHSKNEFVQVNVAGTLALLEAAASTSSSHPFGVDGIGNRDGNGDRVENGSGVDDGSPPEKKVKSFIYISTTSTFGSALSPAPGQPAAWIDESVVPVPKNIYGVTKVAAEDICQLVHKQTGMSVIVLRTSRFFPEEDDDEARRGEVADGENLKVLELAYRRVDVADVVGACVRAMEKGGRGEMRWGRYVVSAPTPFEKDEGMMRALDRDAEGVFRGVVPGVGEVFGKRGWRFLGRVDRVYDSGRAVRELGWRPVYTFERAVEKLARGEEWRSELTLKVGKLGYHDVPTGVYTTGGEGPGGGGVITEDGAVATHGSQYEAAEKGTRR